jgi:hypothetical protein
MFHTLRWVKPHTATEQSAYDRWMDQTRPAGASTSRSSPRSSGHHAITVWFALYSIAGVIVVYMLFFADPGEGAITQGKLMGDATVVITLLILLLMFFDHPHGNGLGALQPTAMQRSLRLIDAEIDVAGLDLTPPCDQQRQASLRRVHDRIRSSAAPAATPKPIDAPCCRLCHQQPAARTRSQDAQPPPSTQDDARNGDAAADAGSRAT